MKRFVRENFAFLCFALFLTAVGLFKVSQAHAQSSEHHYRCYAYEGKELDDSVFKQIRLRVTPQGAQMIFKLAKDDTFREMDLDYVKHGNLADKTKTPAILYRYKSGKSVFNLALAAPKDGVSMAALVYKEVKAEDEVYSLICMDAPVVTTNI